MSNFETFNQFDSRFKGVANFGDDCNACPLFALFTAKKFMDNGDISKQQHEHNLKTAIANHVSHPELPKYMSFDELLTFTGGSYSSNEVGATTPQLMATGILGYDSILKDGSNDNYCVIFLKNSNFIVVMVKNEEGNNTFSVRDCHEVKQPNFETVDSLKAYLNKTYQFDQMTVVDGVLIEEFGNIEYLVVDHQFDTVNVDSDLHYDDGSDDNKDEIQDLEKGKIIHESTGLIDSESGSEQEIELDNDTEDTSYSDAKLADKDPTLFSVTDYDEMLALQMQNESFNDDASSFENFDT